jgi:hypothetical protein
VADIGGGGGIDGLSLTENGAEAPIEAIGVSRCSDKASAAATASRADPSPAAGLGMVSVSVLFKSGITCGLSTVFSISERVLS